MMYLACFESRRWKGQFARPAKEYLLPYDRESRGEKFVGQGGDVCIE